MPKTYELKAARKMNFDGQTVEENKVVAVLITDQPLYNVLSAASFGGLFAEETAEVTVEAAAGAVVARQVDEPDQPKREAAPPADPATDPDALNAADAAAELAEAEAAAKAAAEADAAKKAAEAEQPLPAEFEGLDVRIAKALVNQGFETKGEVKAFIDEGGDLVDLDAIGKAAAAKIKTWLGA